jgi:hypothetical protein
LKTSNREVVAVTVAVVAVIVSGVMGARATTAPEDLACEFVGLSHGSDLRYPTAISAAAGYASGALQTEPTLLEMNGGVIEVPASATLEGDALGAKVFALRDHGRTVGLLSVHRDFRGWGVGRVELC